MTSARLLLLPMLGLLACADAPTPLAQAPECAGAATLEVGTGYQEFVSLEPGDSVEIVAGSQGGYHITTAMRFCDVEMEAVEVDLRITEVASGLVFCDLRFARSPRADGECCTRVDTVPGYLFMPEELVGEGDPGSWLDGQLIEISASAEIDGVVLSGSIELVAER